MNEDLGPALREIADLLRQRVELAERALQGEEERHREYREKTAGMMEKLKAEMPESARDPGRLEERMREREAKMEERQAKMDARVEEDRHERRAFQDRLVGELERHNLLLEKLLFQLGQSSRPGSRSEEVRRGG